MATTQGIHNRVNEFAQFDRFGEDGVHPTLQEHVLVVLERIAGAAEHNPVKSVGSQRPRRVKTTQPRHLCVCCVYVYMYVCARVYVCVPSRCVRACVHV